MKIFLITDIHYGENSNYPNLGGPDYINVYGQEFQRLIPELRNEMKTCDLIVNLGDFIRDESSEKDTESYKEAMALLPSDSPIKYVPGNHDLKNLSKEIFATLIGEARSYYSFDRGGFHHIVLDANPTEPRGPIYVSEEQLVWLKTDLEKTELKSIIYCHHPLDNQKMDDNYYFMDRPERASVNNKAFVRKVIRESGKVIAVFSGHTHFYCKQEMDGVTYFTIPSFSENNGNHRPNATYGIATIQDSIDLEIKEINLTVLK